MEKKGIAIFGGSFNPPINSHFILAKEILTKYNRIEKIIFVPVSTKYKKDNLIADKHRYDMLKIMCNNQQKLEVSNIELITDKQLYTIQTLDFFKKMYKENEIYFIMGTDNLKEIKTWREPARLLEEYKIIVLERENDKLENIIKESELLIKYKNSLIKVDEIDKIFLSSTMIRDKIKKGEDVKEFINEEVFEYIKENKLYV